MPYDSHMKQCHLRFSCKFTLFPYFVFWAVGTPKLIDILLTFAIGTKNINKALRYKCTIGTITTIKVISCTCTCENYNNKKIDMDVLMFFVLSIESINV